MSLSHPVRGAWIEIVLKALGFEKEEESHPVRGAWIEIDPAGGAAEVVNCRTP